MNTMKSLVEPTLLFENVEIKLKISKREIIMILKVRGRKIGESCVVFVSK